jgi:ATP-dependent 26S proteasome regulatory subunit
MGAPSIVFFDEMDVIVGNRSLSNSESEGVSERVLATLLNEIDGIEQSKDILLIAATNRPDLLDSAILRPGRIDVTIYVPPPDLPARVNILEIFTRKMPLNPDVDMKKIAEKTEYCTGADLENMVREAGLIALREDLKAETVVSSLSGY